MRRALYLLAVVVVGAASAASAQARAITVARLIPQAKGAPAFGAHVSNLLDDPDWNDRWSNAFFIQVHWKVQVWQDRTLFPKSFKPTEWNVCVRQVPGLDLFSYTGTGEDKKTFSTLDSLKAYLAQDISLGSPRGLASGSWYYAIDVRVSTSDEDPCAARVVPKSGGFLQGLVLGGGPTRDLPQVTLQFKVP